jgi:nitrite reductase/ring-hydroxylating ferredoxin subunit/uncharacterized membrane protein
MGSSDISSLADRIEEQEWLTPVSESLQSGVESAFKAGGETGQSLKNFLHGTWLGHPLHPALTDVPLGAWTVSFLLDIWDQLHGREETNTAADAAIGIGLLGATGAAITGITDWQGSGQQAPNSGVAHASLNIGATVLHATSLILRKRGSISAGRSASLAGYALLMSAAYLGGKLVYDKQIGVDHGQRSDLPSEWTSVLPLAELPLDQLKRVMVGDIKVLLVRRSDGIFAIGEVCSHLAGPLAEGELICENDTCSVRCPWHGSRFDLATGAVIDGPSTYPQPKFETRVRNGQIEVRHAPEV